MIVKEKKLQLLVATHNRSKLVELYKALEGIPYELISLADLGIEFDVEETGTTFEENAILKAKAYCALSGLPTLSDDSGLEIDALNGEPGIYTKRYLGEHKTEEAKRQALLQKMAHVPSAERGARFTSVMALAWPDGRVQLYSGFMMGAISTSSRGTPVPYFPYWNVFECLKTRKTCSELRDEGRDPGVHRAIAAQKLLEDLAQ
jgi:XTP/dITP diphosphohydrolase